MSRRFEDMDKRSSRFVGALIFLFLFSCGRKGHEEVDPQGLDKLFELKDKYDGFKEKAKKEWDQETGWPSAEDCDGTLWAGLARSAGLDSVNLVLAKYADGSIHRRPKTPCYANGQDLGAKSTISKDMLLGYVFGMWRSSNKDELEHLFNYGRDHNWIMGEPTSEIGRVLLTPNGIATLCKAIRSLGGSDKTECHLPVSFSTGNADFEKHLAVLGILLWGEVSGEIPNDALHTLEKLAGENQTDALFTYAYSLYSSGNFNSQVDLLLGNYSYPSYVRGSENYKLVHWLFAANLILRKYSALFPAGT